MNRVLKCILILIYFLSANSIFAQSSTAKIFVKYNTKTNTNTIKWYLPNFINQEPVLLWVKYNNQEWKKLAEKSFSFSTSAAQELTSKVDKDAFALCSAKERLSGVAFLQVLKQSFYSFDLCQKIGLAFQHTLLAEEGTLQYKITSEKSGTLYIETAAIRIKDDYPSPTNIDFTVKQNKKSVDLIWKNYPENIWGLLIQRKTKDSIGAKFITQLPALQNAQKSNTTLPDFVDNSVLEKNSYTYQLLGINHFGDTIPCSSAITIEVKDITAPEPSQIVCHKINKSVVELQLKQNHNSDAHALVILRTTKSDTDYKELRRVPYKEGDIIFRDSVPEFQSYFYKIRCIDANGNFSDSRPFALEVPDTDAPQPAINISCKADSNYISLAWENQITKDWAGCYVFRSINDTNASYFVRITPEPIKNQNYVDTLPTNTKNRYYYKLISLDSSLNFSAYSKLATARLPDKTAPSAPFISFCTKTKNGIVVNWFKNPESDLLQYELTIADTINKENSNVSVIDKDSIHHNFEIKNLPAYFKINLRAIDSSGNKSTSSNQHDLFFGKESLPRNQVFEFEAKGKITTENYSCMLTWNLKEYDQVRGYTVYRSEDNAKESYPISGFIVEQKEFQDTSIEKQHLYRYHVRALMQDGQLIHTNTIEIKTYPHEKNKFRLRKK